MSQISVIQRPQVVNIINTSEEIAVIQRPQAITIQSTFPTVNFLTFSFTATISNQVVFTPLPATPVSVISLFITGAGQNQKAGDFTVSGTTITLSQGVNIGDTVYGVIQV